MTLASNSAISRRSRMMQEYHVRFFGKGPGVWGSRERKIRAAHWFLSHTPPGSVFMLLAISLIFFQTGTIDLHIPLTTESIYIWLPEAHVEALTAGSVILAGILSKLGTYGFLRFSVPMFPGATLYFTPFIYTLSIIAYSSVAYMNFVTTGMSSRAAGIEGSILPTSSYGPVLLALSSCVVATSAALGMILGAAYPLWPHNRVVFGNSKPKFLHRFSDLNRREVLAMRRRQLTSIGNIACCERKERGHATFTDEGRPSLFDRVSKGQLNGLLMNARLDEPMNRTRSARSGY
ncbi:hypothetical protein KP509_1Z280000 [Ceratopteris richardii]|nr:hypothetical protein KP509_1Z280000 [Ceratopteris richardii]